MRKILLGTTAVVGAALLAPTMAAAQEAPTVRVGGYFRVYYGYTRQTSPHSTGWCPSLESEGEILACRALILAEISFREIQTGTPLSTGLVSPS